MLQKNQIFEVEITGLAYGGEGVGRVDGYVVFVPWTVPGDKVQARLIFKKKDYGRAKAEVFLVESPLRVKAPCPYFMECGGCRWQNMAYDDQVRFKQETLQEALGASSGPIQPSPSTLNYRNKMEFTFGENDKDELVLGLHRAGDYTRIVDLEKCLIQTEAANRVFEVARRFFQEACFDDSSKITVYNKNTHKGLLRYLILRSAQGKVLVNIVTNSSKKSATEIKLMFGDLVDALAPLPETAGVIWSVSSAISDAVKIDKEILLYGEDNILEKVGDIEYSIRSQTFFQTNSAGTKVLYDIVRDYITQINDLTEKQTKKSRLPLILDLFCGIGSIGLYVADLARRVVGIEIVAESIIQAQQNARLNGIKNAEFIVGDVKDVLSAPETKPAAPDLKVTEPIEGELADIVIIDPPRAGMSKQALKRLLELEAPHIIYVSCNPTTLARDLDIMRESEYFVEEIQAVDMFPQTYHLETVVRLSKRSN